MDILLSLILYGIPYCKHAGVYIVLQHTHQHPRSLQAVLIRFCPNSAIKLSVNFKLRVNSENLSRILHITSNRWLKNKQNLVSIISKSTHQGSRFDCN